MEPMRSIKHHGVSSVAGRFKHEDRAGLAKQTASVIH